MENEPQDFDRIQYVCSACRQPGYILAVWISVTRIKLEGCCLRCGKQAVRSFDLLVVDAWLRDEADNPCTGDQKRASDNLPAIVGRHADTPNEAHQHRQVELH